MDDGWGNGIVVDDENAIDTVRHLFLSSGSRLTVKRSVLVRSLPLLLPLSLLLAAAIPGCDDPLKEPCPNPGETYWLCTIAAEVSGCDCRMERDYTEWACATNAEKAYEVASLVVEARMEVWRVRNKGCVDTGSRHPQAIQPKFKAQDFSGCPATSGDDACVTCAKSACCSQYQACTSDANCLCWIGCKAGGSADDVCAMPGNCGPLDSIALSTAACLNASCPECLPMSACTCDG
jgi:hypothetical protein